MARAAFIWSDGEHLRLVELDEDGTKTIGRGSDASVTLDDLTVSRHHAAVSGNEGMFVLENRSETNPTKLNSKVIEQPAPLSDGDVAELGSVRLVFHDLATADRVSGPICSYDQRENMPDATVCWHCGNFLVNAQTTIIEKRAAGCRVVSAAGARYDLHANEAFVIHAGGQCGVVPSGSLPDDRAAVIELEGGHTKVTSVAQDAPLSLNGQPLPEGRTLETGDELRAGSEHYVVILR